MRTHDALRLERGSAGGFVLAGSDGSRLRAEPDGDGWRVEGPEVEPGWRLARGTDEDDGFFLVTAAESREDAARTLRAPDASERADGRAVLLADGRLFRLVLRGPRAARWELAGWEAPGAYFVARPAPEGWEIEPQPASGALDDVRALLILFAAEVLDAEESGGRGDDAES